ncbi:MAG TPA: hypothetical protein VMJ10_04855 [Kofleriaceae bacterium]|nr:hypothetical protein [Kofleriaceae bacterium]
MGLRALIGLALALGLALGKTAHADPSNTTLVYVGLGMAPVDYLAGVSLHEGSHGLAAWLVGADVEDVHVFPPGIDPHVHRFRFGWTYVRGLHGDGDKTFFYLAPKISDLALLGGFAALVYTSAWPSNRYGQLALTVVGTGLWVDFAKDVVPLGRGDDVSIALQVAGISGWHELGVRLLYAAADVGLAFVVAHGYERTFDRAPTSTALTLPLFAKQF